MTNELHPGEVLTAETVGLLDRGRITHDVKCWPEPFEAVRSRQKPWELRLNDRDYRVGDTLRQHKWDPNTETYTGDIDEQDVVWALYGPTFGLPDGYVIMTLSASDEGRGSRPSDVPTERVPADVAELVIAARAVAFEDRDEAAIRRLDKASEAFASRVPWDDEPVSTNPCGGCGEPEPSKRCVGCLHDFTAPTHPQEAASVPGEGGDTDKGNHDCLAKRRPDEPMFILLGRDPDAHNIVRTWADRRLAAGGDPDHCRLGYETAERMRLYASDPANRPASAPDASAYTHPAREDGPAGQWQDIVRCGLSDIVDAASSFCDDGDLLAGEVRVRVKRLSESLAEPAAPTKEPA